MPVTSKAPILVDEWDCCVSSAVGWHCCAGAKRHFTVSFMLASLLIVGFSTQLLAQGDPCSKAQQCLQSAAQEQAQAIGVQGALHAQAAQAYRNAASQYEAQCEQQRQQGAAERTQQLLRSQQEQQRQMQNSFNDLANQVGQIMRNNNSGNQTDSPNSDQNRQSHDSNDQRGQDNESLQGKAVPRISSITIDKNQDGTEEYSGIPNEAIEPSVQPDVHFVTEQGGPKDSSLSELIDASLITPDVSQQLAPDSTLSHFLDFPQTNPKPAADPDTQTPDLSTLGDQLFGGNQGTVGDATERNNDDSLSDRLFQKTDQNESQPAEPMDLEKWHALSMEALYAGRESMQKRNAISKLEDGITELDAPAKEGIHNATLSQIGAGGQALQAAGEIGAEFSGPQVKYTFKTVKAMADLYKSENDGDTLINETKVFSNFRQLPSQSEAPFSTPPTIPGSTAANQDTAGDARMLGKAADVLNLAGNLKKGGYDGNVGAIKDVASIGNMETAKKVAVTAKAIPQIVDGVANIIEGERIKDDIQANLDATRASLQKRKDNLQAEAERLEMKKSFIESILFPANQ